MYLENFYNLCTLYVLDSKNIGFFTFKLEVRGLRGCARYVLRNIDAWKCSVQIVHGHGNLLFFKQDEGAEYDA